MRRSPTSRCCAAATPPWASFTTSTTTATAAATRNPAEMSERIVAAAEAPGIALTLLPVLYTSGGVGAPPEPEQRRFTIAVDEYLALLAELDVSHRAGPAAARRRGAPQPPRRRPERARGAARRAHQPARSTSTPPSAPRRWPRSPPGSVRGPIEWLLAHTRIDERWCVIHATHMTAAERQRPRR